MISRNEAVLRREAVETRPVHNGALLIDMNSGRCYRLNRVGAEVWSLLQPQRSLSEICALVASKYAMPIEQITSEVEALIGELLREQLVSSPSTTPVRAP